MLLAVLKTFVVLEWGTQDVFVNMAGGIYVERSCHRISLFAPHISQWKKFLSLIKSALAAGIGLGGELRAVNRIEHEFLKPKN